MGVLQDQVYSFNLGSSSGIIITKKIVVNVILSLILITLLHYKATKKHDKFFLNFVDDNW